jgi:hypothetical protein
MTVVLLGDGAEAEATLTVLADVALEIAQRPPRRRVDHPIPSPISS